MEGARQHDVIETRHSPLEAPVVPIAQDISSLRPYFVVFDRDTLAPTGRLAEKACLLEDGTLLVRQGPEYQVDVEIFSYEQKIHDAGVSIRARVPADLEELQNAYARGRAQSGPAIVGIEQRQRQVLHEIVKAKEAGASDIHFRVEGGSDGLGLVRYRLDGALRTIDKIASRELSERMAAMFNAMTSARSHGTLMPHLRQDARIGQEWLSEAGLYGARIATQPLEGRGQMVVLRLLYDNSHLPKSLADMGYTEQQLQQFERVIDAREGMSVVSGPTGSGKSTLLQSICTALMQRGGHEQNGITLEDPVEYTIGGWNQSSVPVDEKGLAQWAASIRALLRLDVDVAMVGEMRDADSMLACSEIAASGHPVLTTLHANGGIGVLQRLKDKGVPRDVYGNHETLRALIAQKLVPTVCPHCGIPWDRRAHAPRPVSALLEGRVHRLIGDMSRVRVTGAGCSKCRFGISGRHPICEVVEPDYRLMEIFVRDGGAAASRYWRKEMGGTTRAMHLAELIRQGKVCPVMGEVYGLPLDFDGDL